MAGHDGGNTLYGILSLTVLDENGDELISDVLIDDMDLKYDPNPGVTIVVCGVGGEGL